MKIADMKLTMAGQAQGLEILRAENAQLRSALQRFVTAAKSWHDFHHGSKTVQCDWICECLPAGEKALAGVAEHPQAPIAQLTINQGGEIAGTVMYAPGLPPGDHDLYCEPEAVAPYSRAGQPGASHDQ